VILLSYLCLYLISLMTRWHSQCSLIAFYISRPRKTYKWQTSCTLISPSEFRENYCSCVRYSKFSCVPSRSAATHLGVTKVFIEPLSSPPSAPFSFPASGQLSSYFPMLSGLRPGGRYEHVRQYPSQSTISPGPSPPRSHNAEYQNTHPAKLQDRLQPRGRRLEN